MTPRDPAHGEPGTAQRTVCAHRFRGVPGAGRVEAARGGQNGRKDAAIQGDRKEEDGREDTAASAGHSNCRFGLTISRYADQSARSCSLVEHPRRCQRLLDVTGHLDSARVDDGTAGNQDHPEVRIIPFVLDGSGGFPEKPPGAVSLYRAPDLTAGHNAHAQTVAIGILMIKDNRMAAYDLSAAAVTNAELPALLERLHGLPSAPRGARAGDAGGGPDAG